MRTENRNNKMAEKYSCPKCGKELDEKYVIVCTCPHCHGIFDKPTIQQVSSQEDQEKEHFGEGGADEKIEEEHKELPSKTINRIEFLAVFSLLIILFVSYFTISRIATNKKATQEKSQPAMLVQHKEGENTTQEEIPQVEKLKELEGGITLPTVQQQKGEEGKKQEGILRAEKLQEAEEKATRAEKLQQEAEKTLKEMRLAAQEGILRAEKLQEAEEKATRTEKLQQEAEKTLKETRFAVQKEEEKKQEVIIQAKKLQELEERITSAKKLQQEAEKTLKETRLIAQKEEERQFQYYYNKGESALQNNSYADALESYQAALTYKLGDPETQKKISDTFAKLQYVQGTKQAEPSPKKKQVIDMVLVPAGEFRMGSPRDEGAAEEYLRRKVFLSAYYIDKYEVTVAQYRAFCQATGRKMPKAPSWGWQDNHPIIQVTWDDAVAYANHYGKRLPTEAEWEKAARAGSTTRHFFGDNETDLKDYAWYSVNSGNQTHPVGTRKPNAFGLYDMHGNVWEWCSDWYDYNYYANSPTKNPQGPTSGALRVVRGGGWGYTADSCRSAFRYKLSPSYWDGCLGFRCASSP